MRVRSVHRESWFQLTATHPRLRRVVKGASWLRNASVKYVVDGYDWALPGERGRISRTLVTPVPDAAVAVLRVLVNVR
jgi:hypothetical protein